MASMHFADPPSLADLPRLRTSFLPLTSSTSVPRLHRCSVALPTFLDPHPILSPPPSLPMLLRYPTFLLYLSRRQRSGQQTFLRRTSYPVLPQYLLLLQRLLHSPSHPLNCRREPRTPLSGLPRPGSQRATSRTQRSRTFWRGPIRKRKRCSVSPPSHISFLAHVELTSRLIGEFDRKFELRAREISLLVEWAPTALFSGSPSGQLTYVNRQFRDLTVRVRLFCRCWLS